MRASMSSSPVIICRSSRGFSFSVSTSLQRMCFNIAGHSTSAGPRCGHLDPEQFLLLRGAAICQLLALVGFQMLIYPGCEPLHKPNCVVRGKCGFAQNAQHFCDLLDPPAL